MCYLSTPCCLGYLLLGNKGMGEHNRNNEFHSRNILNRILGIFPMSCSYVENLCDLNPGRGIALGAFFRSDRYCDIEVYVRHDLIPSLDGYVARIGRL